MVISPNRNAHRLSHAFVEAARLLGPARQHSYNGGAYEGAWITELAHRDGRRFSAYDAYLKPALRRPNLTVMKDAQVLRADIENGRTLGVTLRRGGADHVITARGVVLAAGAIGSPQLLMLSGVGPPETLARLGIAVQRDAPEVGENLQDHPMSAVSFRVRGTDTLRSAASLPSLLRYLLFRRGMLASNAVEAIAFAR